MLKFSGSLQKTFEDAKTFIVGKDTRNFQKKSKASSVIVLDEKYPNHDPDILLIYALVSWVLEACRKKLTKELPEEQRQLVGAVSGIIELYLNGETPFPLLDFSVSWGAGTSISRLFKTIKKLYSQSKQCNQQAEIDSLTLLGRKRNNAVEYQNAMQRLLGSSWTQAEYNFMFANYYLDTDSNKSRAVKSAYIICYFLVMSAVRDDCFKEQLRVIKNLMSSMLESDSSECFLTAEKKAEFSVALSSLKNKISPHQFNVLSQVTDQIPVALLAENSAQVANGVAAPLASAAEASQAVMERMLQPVLTTQGSAVSGSVNLVLNCDPSPVPIKKWYDNVPWIEDLIQSSSDDVANNSSVGVYNRDVSSLKKAASRILELCENGPGDDTALQEALIVAVFTSVYFSQGCGINVNDYNLSADLCADINNKISQDASEYVKKIQDQPLKEGVERLRQRYFPQGTLLELLGRYEKSESGLPKERLKESINNICGKDAATRLKTALLQFKARGRCMSQDDTEITREAGGKLATGMEEIVQKIKKPGASLADILLCARKVALEKTKMSCSSKFFSMRRKDETTAAYRVLQDYLSVGGEKPIKSSEDFDLFIQALNDCVKAPQSSPATTATALS